MKKDEGIMIIIGVIGLLLILNYLNFFNFSFFSILGDPSYTYEKSYSYNGINLIAKSDYQLGSNSTTYPFPGDNNGWEIVSFNNLATELSLEVSSSSSKSSSNPIQNKAPSMKTFLTTTNLILDTPTLEKISFNVNSERSISCTESAYSQFTQANSIYLVNENNEILLWSAPSAISSSYIEVYKAGNNFILSINGATNVIDIPEGEYEILVYAPLLPVNYNSCQFKGGSASQKIALTNFKITRTPICVPEWDIGNWGDCVSGAQTRIVEDLNNCGKEENKPITSQTCTVSCTNGDDKCEYYNYYECVDNEWVDLGNIPGQCGYTAGTVIIYVNVTKNCNNLGCPINYTCQSSSGLCIKTDYLHEGCKELGCPSSFTCDDDLNVCTRTIENEFDWKEFLDQNYLLIIIIGGMIILLLISSRR